MGTTSTSTAAVFALSALGITSIVEFVYFAIFFGMLFVIGWVIIAGLRPIWLLIR